MHLTKRISLSIFSALLAAAPGLAQTFQGGIRGTVHAAAGAAIAVAKVSMADEGTGIARSTVTGSGGEYSFANVTPATYTLSAEKPGFSTLTQKGLVVGTQEFITADLKLQV